MRKNKNKKQRVFWTVVLKKNLKTIDLRCPRFLCPKEMCSRRPSPILTYAKKKEKQADNFGPDLAASS